MIKLFYLLYIHLLSLFNKKEFQKKKIENFNIKSIFVIIVSILYGFLFYILLKRFHLDNFSGLEIAFLFSTLFCLFYDIGQSNVIIFKEEENKLLFSLPLKRNEILLSKLFKVYLKNIFFVFLFFFSALLAASENISINETFVLLYFVMILFIPFIPIVISSVLSFLWNHFKVKNSFLLKIVFLFILIAFFVSLFSLFKDRSFTLSEIFSFLHNILSKYPLSYLFFHTLRDFHLLSFFLYLSINILFLYLYILFISPDYEKICSLLKGIKKRTYSVYKKRRNRKRFGGYIYKEVLQILQFPLYFKSSFFFSIFMSILLVFLFSFSKVSDSFFSYFNLYGPLLLGAISSFANSAIHSFSLEREHIRFIGSIPLSFNKIFFSKLVTNLFFGGFFILFNATFLWLRLKPNTFVVLMLYLFPFFTLLMNSFVSLLLDCIFIDTKNKNETSIIKERFITIIPFLCSIFFIVLSFFFVNGLGYKYILGGDLLICVIILIFCFIFYFLKKRSFQKQVFYK